MTDTLLADLRGYLQFEARKPGQREGFWTETLDPQSLLERLEKRLSLPKLEEHEFILDLEPHEDKPEVIVASLRAVETCDNNQCPCHINNYSEWGIVHGEIPVKVKITGGKRCSWTGEYDDTYVEVSEREVPSPAEHACPLKDLPKADPTDLGPKVVPLSTDSHVPPPNHYPHGVCETPDCGFPAQGCGNGACGCMGICRKCVKCNEARWKR